MSTYKKLMEQMILERPSKAAKAAKAQGLKYAAFGRWEDPGTGKVVAKSKGEGPAAVLIPVKGDDMKAGGKVTPSTKATKKAKAKQKDTPEIPDKPKKKKPLTKKEKAAAKKVKDDNKKDQAKKDWDGKYLGGVTGFKKENDRENYKNKQTKGGKIQPPMKDTKLYPKGADDPEYKKDQAEWEGKQKPGSSWVRPDGVHAAKSKKTGEVQGFIVNDETPENSYIAKAYGDGELMDRDEAKKRLEVDRQKGVEDFEDWKAGLEGDEEKDTSHMGGNFLANLFGVKVPSLTDLFKGN